MSLDRNTIVLLAYLCGLPRYRRALRMVWRDMFGPVAIEAAANGGAP
jgi:hypothetical protein